MSYSESFRRARRTIQGNGCLGSLEDPDEFENTEIGYKHDSENTTLSIAYFELESTCHDKANANAEQTQERDLDIDGIEISYGEN